MNTVLFTLQKNAVLLNYFRLISRSTLSMHGCAAPTSRSFSLNKCTTAGKPFFTFQQTFLSAFCIAALILRGL